MRLALRIAVVVLGPLLAACPTNNVCCTKYDCPGANVCSVADCAAMGGHQGRCIYHCQVDRDCNTDEVCNAISSNCGCETRVSATSCGTCSGCNGN